MKAVPFWCAFWISCCFGQQTEPGASGKQSPAAPPQGVAADWEIRRDMGMLADQVERLASLLERAKPDSWLTQGAPEAYVSQLRSAEVSMRNLVTATQKLARDPGRLTLALEVYFNMQKAELLFNSIQAAIRKYQSPSLADRFSDGLAENSNNRDRLRQHINDLAAEREQEFAIANQEAQRCRGELLRQPCESPIASPKRARPGHK